MEENRGLLKKTSKDKGLALFLLMNAKNNEVSDETLLEDSFVFKSNIPKRYLNHLSLSGSLLSLRNKVVWLTFLEIFSALWGLSFYFIRRSPIYLAVNFAALVLSFIGVLSSINLTEAGLVIYSILTTSLPGTFFLYQILELVMLKSEQSKANSMNDNMMLLIFSLPYVYDFIVGLVTLLLISKISKFNSALAQIRNMKNEEELNRVNDKIAEINEQLSYKELKKICEDRETNKK